MLLGQGFDQLLSYLFSALLVGVGVGVFGHYFLEQAIGRAGRMV